MNEDSDKYANFSHEELVAEIKRLKKNKKYGLVWEHKKEQVIEDFETQQPYLQEVAEKRIENAPGEPTNLIIEGDNFEALSILNYTHAGKVDVIYIDPPYNTGNKDFIYNDNYVDSEDEFRHSKWLSFMEPRLKLAKSLLKDDGVIFISIDDNEQAALKIICDEVFGASNFVSLIAWHKKDNASFLSKNIVNLKEYILIYAKNMCCFGGTEDRPIDISKHRELITKPSKIQERVFSKEVTLIENGKYTGTIKKGQYGNTQFGMEILKDVDVRKGVPLDDIWIKGKFCWSQKTIDEEVQRGGRIEIKSISGMKPIFYKNFGEDVPYRPMVDILSKVFDERVKTTQDADRTIKAIFKDSSIFNYSKPHGLVEMLVGSVSRKKKNAIVLDFFAGSGTTGQAVLELNKEDGGHRQFILCTNNGDKGPDSVKIAEDITYPRMKTVITGKRQDGSKYSDGIPANLRYYKIEHKEKKASIDANRLGIVYYLEDIIQVKENAFEQIEVNEDLALYKNSERFVGMVFEPFALKEIIESIKEKNDEDKPVKLYVFSYSRDAFEDNYETDFEIEFVAMPEGLLKTYANIVAETKKEDA